MTMMRFGRALLGGALGLLFGSAVEAQDLIVYDDALQNTFENYSYGPPGLINLSSTAQVHGGTRSISFIGQDYNAFSAFRPVDLTTAQYPTLHFWVHGGAVGGQQLQIFLQLDDAAVASAPLDTYIAGGSIVAGAWREVTVTFGAAAPFVFRLVRPHRPPERLRRRPAGVLPRRSQPGAGRHAAAREPHADRTRGDGRLDGLATASPGATPRTRRGWRCWRTTPGRSAPRSGGYPNRGGALREFRYQTAGRRHPDRGGDELRQRRLWRLRLRGVPSRRWHCRGIGDDSPLGYVFTGGSSSACSKGATTRSSASPSLPALLLDDREPARTSSTTCR